MNAKRIKEVLTKEDQRKISGGLFASGSGGGTYSWTCCVELTNDTVFTVTVSTVENNEMRARDEARKGYNNVWAVDCELNSGVPAN